MRFAFQRYISYRFDMLWLRSIMRPSYAQKLFLLATMPLVVAVLAIAVLVGYQSRTFADREIQALEQQMLEAKKQELRNYVTQARNGFYFIYGVAAPDDEAAKQKVAQILAAMIYGSDGFFFVYDYNGTNLVSPRQTEYIGRNWSGLTDSQGTPVVDRFIDLAREGAGFHKFMWEKPSTGKEAQMVAYVLGLQDWQWAIGTGVFIDDVKASVDAARAELEARVQQTFYYIGVITFAALMLVFISGMALNIRERRLADAKLKQLTQRVFDAQEEERGRVARELHDGISQILVGVRYALDIARRRLPQSDKEQPGIEMLDRGIEHLSGAIQEVRRISRDLRPGVLDDLGLGPAVKSLTEDFGARTGLETTFSTVVFRNRLDQDAKIALYRIAQEALTNIERHAHASKVSVDLRGHRTGATLRIWDNGAGIPTAVTSSKGKGGLGLRNMQERIDQLDGTLTISSTRSGTLIEAKVPLTHLLPPEDSNETTKKAAE